MHIEHNFKVLFEKSASPETLIVVIFVLESESVLFLCWKTTHISFL